MEVQIGLNLEADQEELFQEQRARVNWLVNGDKNTTFFHDCASTWRSKTKILGLEDEQGHWVTNEEDLLAIASSYFTELFLASTVRDASQIYDNIQRRISPAMNEELLSPFCAEEVCSAIKSMAPLKSSSIDDFSVFYQKYWHIIGVVVIDYFFSYFKWLY